MEKLLDFQKSFYKAIFENDYKLLRDQMGTVDNFENRFNIYFNNIFSSLKSVVRDDFPLCEKILGERKFNQAAFEFVRQFPPKFGCLLEYGREFPFFLSRFFPAWSYIQDVAQIEWAKKEVYYQKDSCPLNPQDIRSIPTDVYPLLSFEFPKAIFMFKSTYPLEEIWRTSEAGERSSTAQLGLSYCLVIRPRFSVRHYWLNAEDFHFLMALYEKKTLREAYETAIIINPQFNLLEALAVAFQREYFMKVKIKNDNKKFM